MYQRKDRSLFGQFPDSARRLRNQLAPGSSILLPDCLDGLILVNVLNKPSIYVTAYEPNISLIDGTLAHDLKRPECSGFTKRIYKAKYQNNYKLYIESFYESDNYETYDLVYVYKSLHRPEYSNLLKKDMIQKLQSKVNPGGTLYIQYVIDLNSATSNNFFNEGEMLSYFNKKDWEYLRVDENRTHRDIPYLFTKNNANLKSGILHAIRKKQLTLSSLRYTYKLTYKNENNSTYLSLNY